MRLFWSRAAEKNNQAKKWILNFQDSGFQQHQIVLIVRTCWIVSWKPKPYMICHPMIIIMSKLQVLNKNQIIWIWVFWTNLLTWKLNLKMASTSKLIIYFGFPGVFFQISNTIFLVWEYFSESWNKMKWGTFCLFVPVKESRKNATSGTVFLQFNYFRQKYLAVMAATVDEGREGGVIMSSKMSTNLNLNK